jgi:glutathione S-transferase
MEDNPRLHWHEDSNFSRIVKWILLDLEIEHQDVFYTWQELNAPEFKSINPLGLVPVWEFAPQQMLTDSIRIVSHLLHRENWLSSEDGALFRICDVNLALGVGLLYQGHRLEKSISRGESGPKAAQGDTQTLQRFANWNRERGRALFLEGWKHAFENSNLHALKTTPGLIALYVHTSLAVFYDDFLAQHLEKETQNLVQYFSQIQSFNKMQAALKARPITWKLLGQKN